MTMYDSNVMKEELIFRWAYSIYPNRTFKFNEKFHEPTC